MAHHDNSVADPKETQNATEMWVNFTVLMKYTVISVVITLILMALFLI